MRTTLNIDDDLLRLLEKRAQEGKTALTKLANRLLRHALRTNEPSPEPFKQKTYSAGAIHFDVTQAQHIADELDDEAMIQKLTKPQ